MNYDEIFAEIYSEEQTTLLKLEKGTLPLGRSLVTFHPNVLIFLLSFLSVLEWNLSWFILFKKLHLGS